MQSIERSHGRRIRFEGSDEHRRRQLDESDAADQRPGFIAVRAAEASRVDAVPALDQYKRGR